MIHVCFGLYDKTRRYSKFTGTTMLSIFDNTNSEVTVHILHDNTLTQDNRDKFIYLAGRYSQRVKFYNVEELCADKIAAMRQAMPDVSGSRYSIATLYRFLIPQLFGANLKKIIYLDSDIIVNLDINELWRIEMGEKTLAATPEVEIYNSYYPFNHSKKFVIINNFVNREDYFNCGVLLINLNHWQKTEDIVASGIEFYREHPQCAWFDQDILNYLFSKNYIKLPNFFDCFIDVERKTPSRRDSVGNAIYHYIGSELNLNMDDPFNRLWMDYFIKTPWFDSETIGRLYDGFRQMHAVLKNSMVNVSAMMSGRTRAFFTLPQNFEAIKEIFSIRDDEEIILAENQDSLIRLINAMKSSQGESVFFILLPNFPFQILINAGFVYGREFVNGLDFLSEAQGVSFNSYHLVKAM